MYSSRQYTDIVCIQSTIVDLGLRIFRVGTATPYWVVMLPDSSTITLTCCSIGVVIQLASTRRGTMVGLCGTNDGNVTNDQIGSDNQLYPGWLCQKGIVCESPDGWSAPSCCSAQAPPTP